MTEITGRGLQGLESLLGRVVEIKVDLTTGWHYYCLSTRLTEQAGGRGISAFPAVITKENAPQRETLFLTDAVFHNGLRVMTADSTKIKDLKFQGGIVPIK